MAVVRYIKYFLYVFIGLCLLAAISGKAQARKYGADNVRAFKILWFSLYTWDFYSDIVFAIRLLEYWLNDEDDADIVLYLFIASVVFIWIPWGLNIRQMIYAQKKWTTDPTVQAGVRGWFLNWSIILVCAVIFSGSSFGAIELANVK